MIKSASAAAGDVVWAPAENHGDFNYTFVAECRIIEVEAKAARQDAAALVDSWWR